MSRGRAPCTAGLAPLQAETLGALYRHRSKLGSPYLRGEKEPGWLRPTDIGASQQSYHSGCLHRLVNKRFVESKPYASRTGATSSARMYRISDIGVSAYEIYAEHLATQGLA